MASAQTHQELMNKAVTVSFHEHLSADVNEHIKALKTGTLTVRANLKPDDQALVTAMFPVPVRFEMPKEPSLRPHEILAVVRDTMRDMLALQERDMRHLKTLHVGAAFREINLHKKEPNAHFSIYGGEAKDNSRVIVPMMAQVTKLVQEAAKKFPTLVQSHSLEAELTDEDVVRLYCELNDLGDRVGFRTEQSKGHFENLRFEDVNYELGWEDYYEIFDRLQSSRAVIQGMLPVDLMDPSLPESLLYKVEHFNGKTRMTDVRGFANGYEHETTKWRCLLERPAYAGKDFNLVAEIRSRVGPFVIIEINRTMQGGTITRAITALPEPYMSVVRVGQILAPPKTAAGLLLPPKVDYSDRFSIRKEEFDSVYSYASSIKGVSRTVEVLRAHVRRVIGGVSLVTTTFSRKWRLQPQDVEDLILVVLLQVTAADIRAATAFEAVRTENVFRKMFRDALSHIEIPTAIWNFFKDDPSTIYKLAVLQDPIWDQTVVLPSHVKAKTHKHIFCVNPKPVEELVVVDEEKCLMCAEMPWLAPDSKEDEQVMKCPKKQVEPRMHKFAMSQSEVDAFRQTLKPDIADPPELIKAKERALERCPRSAFSHECEVTWLLGAFGTGKSHQIKKKVTQRDVVWAPFAALRADYKVDREGNEIKFNTMHAMISRAAPTDRAYVDEAPSVPYEYLAVAAYLCNLRSMWLVGDDKQTSTLPSEGIPVLSRIKASAEHYLHGNFRNPKSCIRWAVEKYGYDMVPMGDKYNADGPFYEFTENLCPELDMISPDRANVDIERTSATIRQWQGKTVDSLQLVIEGYSIPTFSVPSIKLVGLTRARGVTKIYVGPECDKSIVEGLINRVAYHPRIEPLQRKSAAAGHYKILLAALRYFDGLTALRAYEALHPNEVGTLGVESIKTESEVDSEECTVSCVDRNAPPPEYSESEETVKAWVNSSGKPSSQVWEDRKQLSDDSADDFEVVLNDESTLPEEPAMPEMTYSGPMIDEPKSAHVVPRVPHPAEAESEVSEECEEEDEDETELLALLSKMREFNDEPASPLNVEVAVTVSEATEDDAENTVEGVVTQVLSNADEEIVVDEIPIIIGEMVEVKPRPNPLDDLAELEFGLDEHSLAVKLGEDIIDNAKACIELIDDALEEHDEEVALKAAEVAVTRHDQLRDLVHHMDCTNLKRKIWANFVG